MFDLWKPITYTTNVNSVITGYNMRYLNFDGPYYNFGSKNVTNTNSNSSYSDFSYYPNQVYNFGEKKNSGNFYNFTGNGFIGNPFGNSIWNTNPYIYNSEPVINFTGKTSSSNVSPPKVNDVTTVNSTPKVTNENIHKSNQNTKLNQSFVDNAKIYLGYKESDNSYRKFSDSKEWCADFVTYVVKESYEQKGLNPPAGFGNHRVENIKQWGIKNNKYIDITSQANKGAYINQHIQTGNLAIFRENASHIGIVSKIYKDGSFETIEGNVTQDNDDRVLVIHHKANDEHLSGFVQLT